MGDIVAKVVHGEQILAKYQPIVFNPRTSRQVEVRDTFAQIAKILKENRNALTEQNLKPRYNLYAGASKNIRNAVVPFGFDVNEIFRGGKFGKNLKVSNPSTLTESATGQTFMLFLDEFGSIAWSMVGTDLATPGDKYFGSNVLINGNKLFTSSFAPDDAGALKQSVQEQAISLVLVDKADAIGFPKGYGMLPSVEEVGEWNYIYKVNNADTAAIAPVKLDLTATTSQTGGIVFLIDAQGVVIWAGMARFVTTP
jgi:hypothetical protein